VTLAEFAVHFFDSPSTLLAHPPTINAIAVNHMNKIRVSLCIAPVIRDHPRALETSARTIARSLTRTRPAYTASPRPAYSAAMPRISLVVHLPLHGRCHEDFTAMTPTPGGRRCDSCELVVHDLSAMTARAADRFVAARRGQRTCYRYLARPDGTIVFAPEPARAAWSAAVAVTLAACTPHGLTPQLDRAELDAEAPIAPDAPVVIPPAPRPPEPGPDEPCDVPIAQPQPKPRPIKAKQKPAPAPAKHVEYLGFEG
jgi:hypothetical protein